jgi:hypothetical protein
MARDVLTCLRDAERFVREGDRRRARKRLEEALRELHRPMQRLPAWVVPGVKVQWMGEPPHHVYTVVSVDRSKPDWWFSAERTDEHGTKEIMGFHRETGKLCWRRFKHRSTNIANHQSERQRNEAIRDILFAWLCEQIMTLVPERGSANKVRLRTMTSDELVQTTFEVKPAMKSHEIASLLEYIATIASKWADTAATKEIVCAVYVEFALDTSHIPRKLFKVAKLTRDHG